MVKKIKQLIPILLIGGIVYALLSYHFAFFDRDVKPIKKASLTLDYTFVNLRPTEFRPLDKIFAEMRDAGIDSGILAEMGEALVGWEKITPEEWQKLQQGLN